MNNVKETILRTLEEFVQGLRDENECDPEGDVEDSFLRLFSKTEIVELTGMEHFEWFWENDSDNDDFLTIKKGWVVRVIENMSDELSQRTLDMMKVRRDDGFWLLWKSHPSRPHEDWDSGWTDEDERQFRLGWEWNRDCGPQ